MVLLIRRKVLFVFTIFGENNMITVSFLIHLVCYKLVYVFKLHCSMIIILLERYDRGFFVYKWSRFKRFDVFSCSMSKLSRSLSTICLRFHLRIQILSRLIYKVLIEGGCINFNSSSNLYTCLQYRDSILCVVEPICDTSSVKWSFNTNSLSNYSELPGKMITRPCDNELWFNCTLLCMIYCMGYTIV